MAFINQMQGVTVLYSIILIVEGLILSIVAFLIASVVYYAGIENMKFNIGITVAVAFGQGILRPIIGFVMSVIYSFVSSNLNVSYLILGKIYSFIIFIVTIGVLLGASVILVSTNKPKTVTIPVQPVSPVQPAQQAQPVQQTQAAQPLFCPHCGQKVIDGNQFCIYCGNPYTPN